MKVLAFEPGNPDSAIVGTSGSEAARLAGVTAIAFTFSRFDQRHRRGQCREGKLGFLGHHCAESGSRAFVRDVQDVHLCEHAKEVRSRQVRDAGMPRRSVTELARARQRNDVRQRGNRQIGRGSDDVRLPRCIDHRNQLPLHVIAGARARHLVDKHRIGIDQERVTVRRGGGDEPRRDGG